MLIVPYILRNSLTSLCPWTLKPVLLFLENHGKQVCSVENPEEWLQENGFVVKRSWTNQGTYFAEIDDTNTRMKDFYSFEQLTQVQKRGTEECWRTFYMMESPSDEKNSETAWNSCFEEPIRRVLHSIKQNYITTQL
jgi:hypothetical protein